MVLEMWHSEFPEMQAEIVVVTLLMFLMFSCPQHCYRIEDPLGISKSFLELLFSGMNEIPNENVVISKTMGIIH